MNTLVSRAVLLCDRPLPDDNNGIKSKLNILTTLEGRHNVIVLGMPACFSSHRVPGAHRPMRMGSCAGTS